MVGREDQLPMSAHAFTNLPAHLNSAINPIFYGIFNTQIRNGYKNLLRQTQHLSRCVLSKITAAGQNQTFASITINRMMAYTGTSRSATVTNRFTNQQY
jgi:hypothetical protein